MRTLSLLFVFVLIGNALGQDCYTDARGNRVCPLRSAVRVAAAPVVVAARVLMPEQPAYLLAVPSPATTFTAPLGCSGSLQSVAPLAASCSGTQLMAVGVRSGVIRRAAQRSVVRSRVAVVAVPSCGGIDQQLQSVPATAGCGCGNADCACMPTLAPQAVEVHGSVAANSGSAYELALRSAQYRAANGIKGHSHFDMAGSIGASATGVGWASGDSQPNTCLGRGGANYAVARGRDGWYATKIQR